jgi:hypothetical protein
VSMRRTRKRTADYHACIVVRSSGVAKRALEILVRGNDLYAFQPRKGVSIKTSYHESGAFHVKVGKRLAISSSRPHAPTRHLREDSRAVGALRECVYSVSLENYTNLLDLDSSADYDETAEFEITDREGLLVLELDVTNYELPEGDWEHLGVVGKVLSESTLSGSGVSFLVRLRHLS